MRFASTVTALFMSFTPAVAGSIEIVGTGDGMEIVNAIGSAYMAEHPDQIVVVPPSIGSGGGIAAVGAGRAYLARVARPLKPAERASGLHAKPIFRLPSAIYTHPDVGVSGLTSEQLTDIYSGRATNWSDVGGKDLRIRVVRREDTDSTLTVLRNSMPGWANLQLTPKSKTAVTTQEAVETVRQVPGAIGFGPFSRLLEAELNVLTIDGAHPTSASYPSAVTISYVWGNDLIRENERAFVQFGRSERARNLLKALGALPVMD